MASNSISTSALHPEHKRFVDLRARLAALNCELIEDETEGDDRYYVLSKTRGTLVSIRATIDDVYDWCDDQRSTTPSSEAEDSDDESDKDDDRPKITVLVGDHVDAIFGIRGIADALMALDDHKSIELACALRYLSKRLVRGLGSLTGDVEKKIEQAAGMKVLQ